MGASSGETAGSGLTRAHTWGVIIPLLAVLSVSYLSRYVHVSEHQPVNALAAGAVVAVISYFLLPTVKEESHILAKAVLIGLLVSEIMVLKPYGALPTMSTITLWLFFYYHTVEGI